MIAGSAAAGVVFIVSLVAISIVCSRWVPVGSASLGGGGGKMRIRGRKGGMGDPCGQREQHDATADGALLAGEQLGAPSRSLLIPEAWLFCPLFSQEARLQQGGGVQ